MPYKEPASHEAWAQNPEPRRPEKIMEDSGAWGLWGSRLRVSDFGVQDERSVFNAPRPEALKATRSEALHRKPKKSSTPPKPDALT